MSDAILAASLLIGAVIFVLWCLCSLGLYLYKTRPRYNRYRHMAKPVADDRSSLELFKRIISKD